MSIEWIAGLFEGEGCIRKDQRKRCTFELKLGMTDEDVVARVLDTLKCGKIYNYPSNNPKHKDMFRWSLGNRQDIKKVLLLLLPYFGLRRAYTAQNALDEIDAVSYAP